MRSRTFAMAGIPTVAEAGVPGYENSTGSMIAAPARTPPVIVERLNAEMNNPTACCGVVH